METSSSVANYPERMLLELCGFEETELLFQVKEEVEDFSISDDEISSQMNEAGEGEEESIILKEDDDESSMPVIEMNETGEEESIILKEEDDGDDDDDSSMPVIEVLEFNPLEESDDPSDDKNSDTETTTEYLEAKNSLMPSNHPNYTLTSSPKEFIVNFGKENGHINVQKAKKDFIESLSDNHSSKHHCFGEGITEPCSSCKVEKTNDNGIKDSKKGVFVCHHCKLQFSSRLRYITHTKLHNRKKFHYCAFCQKCVTTAKALKSHQNYCRRKYLKTSQPLSQIITNDEKVTCHACKVIFPSPLAVKRHCKCCGKLPHCIHCSDKKSIKRISPVLKHRYLSKKIFDMQILNEVLASCSSCKVVFPTCKKMKQHCLCHGTQLACKHCSGSRIDCEEYKNLSSPVHSNEIVDNEFMKEEEEETDLLMSCLACNRYFSDFSSLDDHCKCQGLLTSCDSCIPCASIAPLSTQNSQYKCVQCYKNFCSEAMFVAHEKTHKKLPNFICNHCGEEFHLKTLLRKHLKQKVCSRKGLNPERRSCTENNSETYVCNTCDVSFVDPERLKNHCTCFGQDICIECFPPDEKQSTYEIGREFQDSSPGSKTSQTSKIMNYVVCNICGDFLSDRDRLLVHENNHKLRYKSSPYNKLLSDPKSVNCQQKQKTKCRKSQNKKHAQYHTDQPRSKRYRCGECGFRSACKTNVIKHLLKHSDELPYQCDVCGKEFKYRWSMTRHAFLHTGLKPYICQFCNAAFADLGNCKAHQRSHLQLKREYKCMFCNITFSSRHLYRKHKSNLHAIV